MKNSLIYHLTQILVAFMDFLVQSCRYFLLLFTQNAQIVDVFLLVEVREGSFGVFEVVFRPRVSLKRSCEEKVALRTLSAE